MKKGLAVLMLLALASSLIFMSCTSASTSTTTTSPTSSITASVASPSATTPSSTTPVSTPQPKLGGTLKIICRTGISALGSPSEGTPVYFAMTGLPAFDFLIAVDRDWNPITTPNTLASSFDITPDGKTITFHLRKGIKFQDGTSFNAEAVKYNFENFKPNKVVPSYMANIASYEVIDDSTLRVVLKKFDAYFLTSIGRGNAAMMASPTALKSTSDSGPGERMVGTGAFSFDSWQRDNYAKYTRLGSYWQAGKPYLDAVEVRQIVEATTGIMAFKAGEAHVITSIAPQEAQELKTAGYQIIIGNTMPPIRVLTPNATDPGSPFVDKRVREALEYAIDKKDLADSMGYGFYEVATQFASKADSRYVSGLMSRDYNPQKAQELLKDAGYPNGFETIIHARSSVDKDFLVAIVTYLQRIGIKATLDMVESAKFSSMNNAGWDGIMVHESMGANLSGMNSYYGPLKTSTFTYTNAYRPDGWLDKLAQALAEPDASKRGAMEKELITIINNEVMGIPINVVSFLSAQHSNVRDLEFSGSSNFQIPTPTGLDQQIEIMKYCN